MNERQLGRRGRGICEKGNTDKLTSIFKVSFFQFFYSHMHVEFMLKLTDLSKFKPREF